MTYTVNKSDQSVLVNIPDGAIDTQNTSIKLIGKNASGYGESINENFVHMLENFASNVQPINPLLGQLWFDKNLNKLKVFLGTSKGWLRIENISVSELSPEIPYKGDLWYDESEDTLKFYSNNNSWVNLGLGASAAGSVNAKYIKDINGVNKPVMEFTVGNKVVAIFSSNDNFVAASGQYMIGGVQEYQSRFPIILKGITLNNENGVNDNNYKFNGIASSAYYADLAERYKADKYIEPGTVVKIGGSKHITTTKVKGDNKVLSVISSNPGFELNASVKSKKKNPFVVLAGKCKCKTIGKITKGDFLMSSDIEGVACKWNPKYSTLAIFAIALESIKPLKKDSVGFIEVVIKGKI